MRVYPALPALRPSETPKAAERAVQQLLQGSAAAQTLRLPRWLLEPATTKAVPKSPIWAPLPCTNNLSTTPAAAVLSAVWHAAECGFMACC